MDGVEALRQMRAQNPACARWSLPPLIPMSASWARCKAGAQGYLLKGAPRDELFTAIRVVDEGGSLLQPVVASRLLRHVSAGADDEQPPSRR